MRKLIIGIGITGVLVTAATLFWSNYSLDKFRKEIGEPEIFSTESSEQDLDSKSERLLKPTIQDAAQTSEASHVDDPDPLAPAIDSSNTPLVETAQRVSTDVRVSPYGFGPYPALPDRWPRDYWDNIRSKEHELIGRVRIKLYEQGTWADGIHMDDETGMVHPIYKDTVYVEWATYTDIDGSIQRYITSSLGHPDTLAMLDQVRYPPKLLQNGADEIPKELGMITENKLPPGIKFMTYDEGAIDPYEFLNLEKED